MTTNSKEENIEKNQQIIKSLDAKHKRNSTISLKKVCENDEIPATPAQETKKKARVSIFETYKPQEKSSENPADSAENQQFAKKFKVLLQHRKENRHISMKFERFFQRCDADAVTQSEETKLLKEEFQKFRREYEKMHQTANKNVERFNLFSSDTNFNNLRAQAKFKKTLIEHLLQKVLDKQDLISLYNKHISMEENIKRNKQLLLEKPQKIKENQ